MTYNHTHTSKSSPAEKESSALPLFNLPRPVDQNELPAEALRRILGLDFSDLAETERRLLYLLDSFYPPDNLPVSRAASDSKKLMTDWLSNQDAAKRLDVEDPTSAAHLFVSMTFGGLAASRKLGQLVPSGDRLVSHVDQAISVFIRGLAIPAA